MSNNSTITHTHSVFGNCNWKSALLILAVAISTSTVYGDKARETQGDDLNNQVQAIKNDAIELTSKLNRLEEKLLYPAHTQLSIFVSMPKTSKIIPRAVSLKIDNKTATHYIYTDKEIQALLSGGIQRLYTGNTKLGKHNLSVTLKMSARDDAMRNIETKHSFNKSEKVKFIELSIGDSKAKDQHILFREWN